MADNETMPGGHPLRQGLLCTHLDDSISHKCACARGYTQDIWGASALIGIPSKTGYHQIREIGESMNALRCAAHYVLATTFLPILVGCAPSLEKTIRKLGYKPVALPSTVHRPGKVVRIVQLDPFIPQTICEYDTYMGPPQPTSYTGADITVIDKLTGNFTLNAEYLKGILAEGSYKYVKTISVSLSNVKVEELTDGQVFEGLERQTPSCGAAIQNALADSRTGTPLGLIQNALRADAVYSVTLTQDTSISAQAREELMKELAVKLGGTLQSEASKFIRGSGLYWGVFPPRAEMVRLRESSTGRGRSPDAASRTEYRVTGSIVARGRVPTPVTQQFESPLHTTNPTCDGERTGEDRFCFDDPAVRVRSVGNFAEMSGNCYRNWAQSPLPSTSSNCAGVGWYIAACRRGPVGDCKGNGWLQYRVTLAGEQLTPAETETLTRVDPLRVAPGEEAEISYASPNEKIATWQEVEYYLKVSITKVRNGQDLATISLDSNNQGTAQGITLAFDRRTGTGNLRIRGE